MASSSISSTLGEWIEIVEYGDLQFSKTDAVLKAMGLSLEKTPEALEELRKKGMM